MKLKSDCIGAALLGIDLRKSLLIRNVICMCLQSAIARAINPEYTTFITGMARGVDIWAAELVLAARHKNADIHLICALPHPDFEKSWTSYWQQRYNHVLNQADLTLTISAQRSVRQPNDSYQIRNTWMVNHSTKAICVFNGEPSGTRNTLNYAKQQGLVIDCLLVQPYHTHLGY